MHRNNVPDTAILRHYVDDTDILHHNNELLVYFLCAIKISSKVKEQLFQGEPFSGCYQI